MDIPLCEPAVDQAEIDEIADVLESGWLAHGPKNEEFEERFADYVGVEHAISMNSCTSALHLAIEANDITGEVLVPSFTWVASANAIVTAGAKPIFVDIRPDSRNIDPSSVEEAITDSTEAIMPVHYGGQSCDMNTLLEIADDHDLTIIEDSAETIGGEYQGRPTGSFGIGCFSFYPTKNITTGEGGMLTTNDDSLAKRVRGLVGHGIPSTTLDREDADESWYRAATQAGYNFRMSNIHAAIGVRQLDRLAELNQKRREHATYLNDRLAEIDGVQPPVERNDRKHVYQMYTVRTGPAVDRDEFVRALNDRGVGASVHFYPPVHQQPRYEDSDAIHVDLSTTEAVASSIVTLPMYPQLEQDALEYMVESIAEVVQEV